MQSPTEDRQKLEAPLERGLPSAALRSLMARYAFLACLILGACDSTGKTPGSTDHVERTPALESKPTEPKVEHDNEEKTEAQKLTMTEIRSKIIKKYGDQLKDKKGKVSFRKLGSENGGKLAEDPLVESYLQQASYHDFLRDGVVWASDMLEKERYLSPGLMWDRKIKIASRKHEEDAKYVKAHYAKSPGFSPLKSGEKMAFEKFWKLSKDSVGKVKSVAKEKNLWSKYAEEIDADLITGIAVHEVIPTDYNEPTRIALMRALFQEGLRIEEIPAIYDNILSFGPWQMSTYPYEGRSPRMTLTRNGTGDIEPYLTTLDLPKYLRDCRTLEQQTTAAVALQYVNLNHYFEKRLDANDRFQELWNSATDLERRSFIATLLGTAHNNPRNSIRALDQALNWDKKNSALWFVNDNPKDKDKINTLDDLRIAYTNIAKRGHSVSGRHGLRTGELVAAFSRYNMDKTGAQDLESTTRTKVDSREAPSTKMLTRERDGHSYYTYTIPNWTLNKVLELLAGESAPALVTGIKAFNHTERFNPGDVLLMPTDFLRPELRNPELEDFSIPSGENAERLARSLVANQKDAELAILYSNQENATSLSDLKGGLRFPKGVLAR